MGTVDELGDAAGDVRWVYEHFADSEIAEGDAPSAGAWGLLSACRADRNAYLKVLERVHPREVQRAGEESADGLLELEGRLVKEWGEVAGVLELSVKRPEFVQPLVDFTRGWKRENPAAPTARQLAALERVEGTGPQTGEVVL
jgi:hypothetical protein